MVDFRTRLNLIAFGFFYIPLKSNFKISFSEGGIRMEENDDDEKEDSLSFEDCLEQWS